MPSQKLGRYFKALVEDLNITAKRYEVELKLVETKGTWYIHPTVSCDFIIPDWVDEEEA